MSIKCTKCNGRHPSVAAVRACVLGKATPAPTAVTAPVAPRKESVVLERLRRQAGQEVRVGGTYREDRTRGDDYRDRKFDKVNRPVSPAAPEVMPGGVARPASPKAVKYATDRLRIRAWEGHLSQNDYKVAKELMAGESVDANLCRKLIDVLGTFPYKREERAWVKDTGGDVVHDCQSGYSCHCGVETAVRPVSAPPADGGTPVRDPGLAARIRGLKALVPDSRYAVEVNSDKLRFFLVTTGNNGKYTVIKEYASDTLHAKRFTEYEEILTSIVEAGPKAAQVRFGQELGQCYHCNRILTDETSRELGIGPVCRNK